MDIQINYGIKTGCNEAFIINTKKRDEILAACADEDEHKRTAELIRPILRGKDMHRYKYNWAGKWLIATFPSLHYDIEKYPAVKEYLLSFGIERLEQTGCEYIIDGQKIKSRKKTNNKWFEMQDSINYWEEFSKPKIVYQELCRKGSAFALDTNQFLMSNTGYLLTSDSYTSDEMKLICDLLNSHIALYQLDHICTKFDETGWRWLRQFVEEIRFPKSLEDWKTAFYLTEEEIEFISSKYIHVLPL